MPRRKAAKRADKRAVEAVRHKDKRKNIPTEELRDFVVDDEHQPETGKIAVEVINHFGDEVLKVYDIEPA